MLEKTRCKEINWRKEKKPSRDKYSHVIEVNLCNLGHVPNAGSKFPNQGSNSCPLQGKQGSLTTGMTAREVRLFLFDSCAVFCCVAMARDILSAADGHFCFNKAAMEMLV